VGTTLGSSSAARLDQSNLLLAPLALLAGDDCF